MEKKQTKKRYIKRIIIINILLNIVLCESECGRDTPIRVGTQCQFTYCEESEGCIKSNSIIKTQWLNNIILVGENNFRYINFVTSDETTIFYTTPYPVSRERIFFGINSIGEPIFKDSNGNNVYIYQKNSPALHFNQYESIAGALKINGDINEKKNI